MSLVEQLTTIPSGDKVYVSRDDLVELLRASAVNITYLIKSPGMRKEGWNRPEHQSVIPLLGAQAAIVDLADELEKL